MCPQFLGRLFGAALRTRVLLPLSLPRLFWRPLVGLPLRLDDLEAIALSLVQGVITPLRNCSTPEQFDEAFHGGVLKWYAVLVSQQESGHVRVGNFILFGCPYSVQVCEAC